MDIREDDLIPDTGNQLLECEPVIAYTAQGLPYISHYRTQIKATDNLLDNDPNAVSTNEAIWLSRLEQNLAALIQTWQQQKPDQPLMLELTANQMAGELGVWLQRVVQNMRQSPKPVFIQINQLAPKHDGQPVKTNGVKSLSSQQTLLPRIAALRTPSLLAGLAGGLSKAFEMPTKRYNPKLGTNGLDRLRLKLKVTFNSAMSSTQRSHAV